MGRLTDAAQAASQGINVALAQGRMEEEPPRRRRPEPQPSEWQLPANAAMGTGLAMATMSIARAPCAS